MARWERNSSITGKLQSLLLFLCFVCLLIASLGPPVYRGFKLASFHIKTRDGSSSGYVEVLDFGTFGYCSSSHGCSKASIGYNLASVLRNATHHSGIKGTITTLTKMLLAIPITAGLALVGFIISASGHHLGSAIWAAVFGIIVNICSAICVAAVNLTMGSAQYYIKDTSAQGYWGASFYLIVMACALSGFAWIFGVIECCLARQHKKNHNDVEYVAVGTVPNASFSRGTEPLVENAAPIGVHVHNYRDPYADVPTPSDPQSNRHF